MSDPHHRPGEPGPLAGIAAADSGDQQLLANVRPAGWQNPRPRGRYNLVVVGAGTAGLVTAAGAAGLGARVALVERALLGGDCLNTGCVPSKAIIRSARAAAECYRAADYGVRIDGRVHVDFRAVMARMRRLRARISANDSAARFRELGVDVFIGDGRFVGGDAIEVGGESLRFARACIATGARPLVPPVEGLDAVGYLTNETLFGIDELPARLAVVGGGPIGCEMAQTFARFGSEVVLIEMGERLLVRDDEDAAAIVGRALVRDGVEVLVRSKLVAAAREYDAKRLTIETGGARRDLVVDEILVAVGRQPNVDAMGLEAAGVAYDRSEGIRVDDRLRTTNRRIYAAGDVCSTYKFTHAADAAARIVLRNALFFGRARADALTIPWCTYTDPEVAHVGLSAADAARLGIEATTLAIDLAEVDRAIVDGETEGLLKVHVRSGTDRIVGATLVASHAGETISEMTVAMMGGAGLVKLAETIHCYPTQAEAIKKAADAYNRSRLTPGMKRLFQRVLALRR